MTTPPPGQGRITAVLGPTNTGKTYLAIERMLGHESGMIGFPLRLLARENYDRIAAARGKGRVALITGEEKIVPPNPRWFVCTVESMPLDKPVSFLAIDEIQMAADPERGHVFTDRLLHARGLHETMFLGSDTIRPLLQRLLPQAEVVARPRFSTLSYAGPKKITRLPRRSAIVGFSASEVYAIAELIRRQRGGTAIVMGALSPRTRNAQVEMFQSGEVDYLVATDAIGMGLNMDVNAVWFAGTRKFDGRMLRALTAGEMGQIAGRAGRHMNDGLFGTTAEVGPLDQELVEQIENHRFDPLRALQWRNTALDYRSPGVLYESLNAPTPDPALIRSREAEDQQALGALLKKADVAAAARSPARVRLLWDVCQVPDFRKTLSEEHARLLERIYLHLTSPAERLPEDWVEGHVKRLERYDGDIDTLMGRIAHVRTWTYIAHRADWLERAAHWQERTRAIEDRLSDALHRGLTQRFVDRRTAFLVRRLKDPEEMMSAVAADGEVTVEGEKLGRLEGFRFAPEIAEGEADQKALSAAAMRALREQLPARLEAFVTCADSDISLTPDLRLAWGGGPVAQLQSGGSDPLSPKIEVLSSDLLDGPMREQIRQRCASWIEAWLKRSVGDLVALRAEDSLSGAGRGLAFQLGENLGVMRREGVEEQIANLTDADRKALAKAGVRMGVFTVHASSMLKPAAIRARAILWAVAQGMAAVPPLPAGGRTSFEMFDGINHGFLAAVGYLPLGSRAVRADIAERLAAMARGASRDSRNAHRAALEAKRAPKPADLAATDGAISEWMFVAAALGEDVAPAAAAAPAPADPAVDPAPADATAPEAAAAEPKSEPVASEEPVEVASPVCFVDSPEVVAPAESAPAAESAPVAEPPPETATSETAASETAVDATQVAASSEAPTADRPGRAPKPRKPNLADLPALPPGWFRATPQMMSVIGCGEAEMVEVLRALGYRVHQPSEQFGPIHAFSPKPRFERERGRGRRDGSHGDRPQGDRPQGERRHDRRGPPPWKRAREGAPGQGEAPGGRDDRTPGEHRRDGRPPQDRKPREDRPHGDRPQGERQQGERRQGDRPQGDRPRGDRPQGDRPRGDRPQGDRPFSDRKGPRRSDSRGPELRLVASTEKAGDRPASDSPFAKLLELKIGKN